jgi:hypothetical protein
MNVPVYVRGEEPADVRDFINRHVPNPGPFGQGRNTVHIKEGTPRGNYEIKMRNCSGQVENWTTGRRSSEDFELVVVRAVTLEASSVSGGQLVKEQSAKQGFYMLGFLAITSYSPLVACYASSMGLSYNALFSFLVGLGTEFCLRRIETSRHVKVPLRIFSYYFIWAVHIIFLFGQYIPCVGPIPFIVVPPVLFVAVFSLLFVALIHQRYWIRLYFPTAQGIACDCLVLPCAPSFYKHDKQRIGFFDRVRIVMPLGQSRAILFLSCIGIVMGVTLNRKYLLSGAVLYAALVDFVFSNVMTIAFGGKIDPEGVAENLGFFAELLVLVLGISDRIPNLAAPDAWMIQDPESEWCKPNCNKESCAPIPTMNTSIFASQVAYTSGKLLLSLLLLRFIKFEDVYIPERDTCEPEITSSLEFDTA